jgi:uncharacterized membrane protein YkoI
MDRLKKVLLGLAALAALALGGAAMAGATSGGNEPAHTDDVQGSGLSTDLEARLKEAALAATGGGQVNAIERDGEKGATYEVEVATTDGSQVDVRLDDQLKVVLIDQDGER